MSGSVRVLLVAASMFVPSALGAADATFVEKGRALGVYEDGSPWMKEDEFLVGSGSDALLLADHDLGDGDFEVRAVMSFEKLGGTRVSMKLGEGWISFDDENSNIVSHKVAAGPDQEHGETRRFLRPGQPFELKLSRKGPRMQLWIDGREVFDMSVPQQAIGSVGFRPNESTVRLHRFRARGSLHDVGRRVRIDPAEFAALEHDERIQHAIEAGSAYLLSHVRERQEAYTASHRDSNAGAVALETYALVVAGVPLESPELGDNLSYLEREVVRKSRTYDLACALFALDAAIAQLEHDVLLTSPDVRDTSGVGRTYRKRMKKVLDSLLTGQNATGAWRYNTSSNDFDHSCTQFAALGLGVAARRGLRIPDETWVRLAEHMLAHQQPDGPVTHRRATLEPGGRRDFAWSEAERRRTKGGSQEEEGDADRRGGTAVGTDPLPDPYVGDESVTVRARGWEYAKAATESANWNMTCSGVSTMMLVYDHGGHALDPELRARVSTSIRDGIGWILENWNPHATLYGLYSLEKVADLGGIAAFDGIDWYGDSSRWLLDSQEKDGSWHSGGTGEVDRISTALALLVLRRATTLLTRNPAERIIVTGSGVLEREREENRAWVYLPRLDRAVSLPGLLSTLRMRPVRPLLELLEELCRHYPQEFAPELVPSLVGAKERLRGSGPRASLDRCLRTVSEHTFDDDAAALAWFDRWSAVRTLVAGEGDPVAALLEEYARVGDDDRLREEVLRGLVRHPDRGARTAVLLDLEHANATVRTLAHRVIVASSVEPPPRFEPEAAPAVRRDQADQVRAWVESRRGQ